MRVPFPFVAQLRPRSRSFRSPSYRRAKGARRAERFRRVLEDGVFDIDIAGGAEAAKDVELFFVARKLAGIAHVEHRRNRSVRLERPAAPRERRRFGSRRRRANFNDQHTADGISGGAKRFVEPREKSGHPIIVGVAAVNHVNLSAGNIRARRRRNVRESRRKARGGDERDVAPSKLWKLRISKAAAAFCLREVGCAQQKALAAFNNRCIEDDRRTPTFKNSFAPFR